MCGALLRPHIQGFREVSIGVQFDFMISSMIHGWSTLKHWEWCHQHRTFLQSGCAAYRRPARGTPRCTWRYWTGRIWWYASLGHAGPPAQGSLSSEKNGWTTIGSLNHLLAVKWWLTTPLLWLFPPIGQRSWVIMGEVWCCVHWYDNQMIPHNDCSKSSTTKHWMWFRHSTQAILQVRWLKVVAILSHSMYHCLRSSLRLS